MKISEIISELQRIKDEHGDLEAEAYDDAYYPVDKYTFYVNGGKLYIRG